MHCASPDVKLVEGVSFETALIAVFGTFKTSGVPAGMIRWIGYHTAAIPGWASEGKPRQKFYKDIECA
jgi:hypothetical protein